MRRYSLLHFCTLAALFNATTPAGAYELFSRDDTHLNANLDAVFGVFHSRESYPASGRLTQGASSWREGYVKYGMSGDQGLRGAGTAYGAFSLVSSATWGDGDARRLH